MLLKIDKKYPEDFVRFLISETKLYIYSSVDISKLGKLDIFLEEQVFTKRKITAKDIIYSAANNLIIVTRKTCYTIEIDPAVTIPYYPEYTLNDIVHLVNYGNLEVNGCKVISDAFSYIENHIKTLYDIYELRT